jgi:hypothetical protein
MSEITEAYRKEIEDLSAALAFTEGRLIDDYEALRGADRPECLETVGRLFGAVSQARDYIMDAAAVCKSSPPVEP